MPVEQCQLALKNAQSACSDIPGDCTPRFDMMACTKRTTLASVRTPFLHHAMVNVVNDVLYKVFTGVLRLSASVRTSNVLIERAPVAQEPSSSESYGLTDLRLSFNYQCANRSAQASHR